MTTPIRPRLASSSEQGFVLVAVLWLLAALALLVTIFTVHLSASARAVSLNDGALQTEALVSAGVELAAYRLQLADEDKRPPQGAFHARLCGTDISVSFITEAARVDLNAAPKELLNGLLTVLGASDDDAKEATDRIVGWRTKAGTDGGGKEDAPTLAPCAFELTHGHAQPALSAEWRAALRGSRIDIIMRPDHVLFRAVDSPNRPPIFSRAWCARRSTG